MTLRPDPCPAEGKDKIDGRRETADVGHAAADGIKEDELLAQAAERIPQSGRAADYDCRRPVSVGVLGASIPALHASVSSSTVKSIAVGHDGDVAIHHPAPPVRGLVYRAYRK